VEASPPLRKSTRVRVSGEKLTVIDGPFTEAKEVVGGYAQFEMKSKQEAIDGAVALQWGFTGNTGRDGG